MIIFIYGENSYLSHQKLSGLKEKFIEKNDDFNVNVVEAENITSLSAFRKYFQTQPLLGTKALVIIKNLLNSKTSSDLLKEITDFLKKNDSDNVIVFFEGDAAPDKRISLYKYLSSQKLAQEFGPLSQYQIEEWIKKEAKADNCGITKEAVSELARSTTNLWQLRNDLTKLQLFVKGKKRAISVEDVKQLVASSIESNIFKMIDFIGQKEVKKAISELEHLIDAGENEIKILSMITYQFRNLVQARDIINQGKTKADLQSKAKLAPFVASKSMNQAENFNLKELKKIYTELLETDYAIKTGAKEPRLALDRLVVGICML